jgi:hypothetical protein
MARRRRDNQSAYNAEYYAANRERIRAQQAVYRAANNDRIRASRKGLTVEAVAELSEAQGNCCAICREPFSEVPHIDHDHTCCPGSTSCGRCVRGLLCAGCNHMLGKAGDRPATLEAGADYLRMYEGREL